MARTQGRGARDSANVVITPVRNAANRLVGFAKITRDLTDKRKADEERMRLVQAREAIRLRDDFLSIASHELKTPLTACSSSSATSAPRPRDQASWRRDRSCEANR